MGGDAPPHLPVRRFDSEQHGLRALLGGLAAGEVASVLLLTRFMDHPSFYRIRDTCRARGVPLFLARSLGAVAARTWDALSRGLGP